jgi:hypothetical protein
MPHVLRDADIRAVPDLTAELRQVKRDPTASFSGRLLERAAPAATRIPGALPAMNAVMARSVTARQRVGTVVVTAVGMFAGGAGFAITPLSLMSLDVIVGGMTQRPRVIDGQVTRPGRPGPHPGHRPQRSGRRPRRPLRRRVPGTARKRRRALAIGLSRGSAATAARQRHHAQNRRI